MNSNLRLRIKGPNGEEKTHAFKGREMVIGRDPECDIRVNDPEVSRRHVLLGYIAPDRISLTDLDSTNGTLVGGVLISTEVSLTPGSSFRIGDTQVFVELTGDDSTSILHVKLSNSERKAWVRIHDEKSGSALNPIKSLLLLEHDLWIERAGVNQLETLLTRIANVMNAENGMLILVDDQLNWTRRVLRTVRGKKLAFAAEVIDETLAKNTTILIPRTSPLVEAELLKADIGSIICAPIRDEHKLWGCIYLDRNDTADSFDIEDLRLLSQIGHLTAIAFHREQTWNSIAGERDALRNDRDRGVRLNPKQSDFPIKTQNRKTQMVLFKALRVAGSSQPVLIFGSSGTGRSVLARRIHADSTRKDAPFIEVDCPAIPNTLIEEELFGMESSGDPSTDPIKRGCIETAHNGTIYLREFSVLPFSSQDRLAELLTRGQLRRKGGQTSIPVDVRVILSTDVDINRMQTSETISTELFNALKNTTLEIPPLKQRPEDIVPLARHFLRVFLPSNRTLPDFSPEMISILKRYQWPGNITELNTAMRYVASICADERVEIGDLPRVILENPVKSPESTASLREQMDSFEAEIIRNALERHHRIVTRAAKELGLSESTLRYRMQRLGIS